MSSPEVGYVELIRSNKNFRRLWLGSVVSLLGDWFNTIALYALILRLTGSEFALGAVFISKMLPWALASPLAGLIVDRYDRRRLMILADVLRAVIVLGFLLVDTAGEVFLVYVLTVLQVVVGSVFQPAQSASVPNVTTERELVTANAIMATTWSVILALGAGIGGFAAEFLGLKAVFILDSLSYVLSAWFIYRTVIPQETDPESSGVRIRTAVREVLEGWSYMRGHPEVGRIALAKATWSLAGGGLVYMLTLIGQTMSPEATAVAIGVLFSARGLGTGIGPIVARATAKDRSRWPAILGACVAFSGVMYITLGLVPWTYAIIFLIILAHATSGANWVLSTVLLQERTPDRWRGRVFATEWLFIMASDTVAILVASLLLDSEVLTLRTVVLAFAALQVLMGLLWLFFVVPRERSARLADDSAAP